MSRVQHGAVDATAQLYMKSQEALVALKVELQKSRTEAARVTNDALTLRDQNRRLLDDQEQLTLARRDVEGKLRFRMRQVMELEQERTTFKSAQDEMTNKVDELQNRLSELTKELNENKTEMKVMEVRNQYLEEKVEESSKNGISFDSYRRLEVELESVKATVKDMNELNRMQEKDLITANEKARKASEKSEKLADEAAAAKQAAAHAIKMSASMTQNHAEERGPSVAKKVEERRGAQHHKIPENTVHDNDESSVKSSTTKTSAASPKAFKTEIVPDELPTPAGEQSSIERPPRPPPLDTKLEIAAKSTPVAGEKVIGTKEKKLPQDSEPPAKTASAKSLKGKEARTGTKSTSTVNAKSAKSEKSAKESDAAKAKIKKKKQLTPKIRVEKEELSSPVGSESSRISFDDSISSAALKETIAEPAKTKTKTKVAPKAKKTTQAPKK